MMNLSAASPAVRDMLEGFSIELTPRDSKALDAAVSRLDPGTEVSLTWIPDADPVDMVAPAAKLRRAGLSPMPHIGARHLKNARQLEELVERLAGAGVDRILVIGGDRARPAGPYDSSLAVMQTGVFQKAGIVRMAIGGFPEGNPHIPDHVLNQALAGKADFARREGLQLSIVTQFCFKAEPIVAWLRSIRARGIDVPVRVGLAGPAGLITLARYAVRCGIGNSLRVLTENPSFARVLTEKGPAPIIQGIAASMDGNGPPLGIAGLHFYVFGGFNRTVDWINAERSGTPPAHT